MFTFRDSIKVPRNIFMGGQVDSLSFQDGTFKFIINGDEVLDINASGISGNSNFGGDVLFVDEVNSRVGINISQPEYSLQVSGDSNFADNILVSGPLSIFTNDLSVSGALTAGSVNLNEANLFAVNLNGNLNVTGNSDFTGQSVFDGDVLITENLTVSGSIQGNINISFSGVVDNLTVSQDASIGNDLAVLNDALVGGNLTVDSDLNVTGGLTVTGDSYFRNNVTVGEIFNIGFGDILMSNNAITLDAADTFVGGGNVLVSGGVLTLTAGDITANSTSIYNICNDYTLAAFDASITSFTGVTIGQDVFIPGDLTVSGTLSANINVTIDGVIDDLSITNDLNVGGSVTVGTDVTVVGDLLVGGNIDFASLSTDFISVSGNPIDGITSFGTAGFAQLVGAFPVAGDSFSLFALFNENLTSDSVVYLTPARNTILDQILLSIQCGIPGDGGVSVYLVNSTTTTRTPTTFGFNYLIINPTVE